ncbi:MAG: phosphate signaling complex protein PhoU [Solirubrobacteraceae bacterium]
MRELRHQFHDDLQELERQTVEGIDLVVGQLDRALESVRGHDVELAGLVVAADDRVDGRYVEVQQGVLSLLARQAPVADDLRIIAAMLHIIRCVERIGDQCANIAKLVALCGEQPPTDPVMIDAIERMGQVARRQVTDTREAFHARHVTLARTLAGHGPEIARLNREIFNRAVEIGENLPAREWAMFMILVARALERVADNAAEIAEQTVFVVTGVFRESPRSAPPFGPLI